jgi:hypothetical protein
VEEIRHTPSLSIAVTGDTRPARRRRLGSGTGRVLGGVLSAGGAPLFGRGKTASSPSSLFDGNKYKPFGAVCQRVVSRGKGKISRVKQKETSFRMSLFAGAEGGI